MKPNDEDLESIVPEEPLPERDVLLEALVDVETVAAPRRRISKTLIAACVLSGLGVWQIVEVSNGGEPMFQLGAKAKTAPTKLHSDGRAPLGRVLPFTDPIAAYLERAKRGMTDQEIRWMIEDFQMAGLDEEEHSLKGILRAKQQLWYLEALTEALQLSPEQRTHAKAQMDAMRLAEFELLEKEFEEEAAKYPNSHPDVRTALESTYLALAGKANWLENDGYAPWNLCELSGQQAQLTMKKWASSDEGRPELISDPFAQTEEDKHAWINLSENWAQDPLTGNLTELLLQNEVDPFIIREAYYHRGLLMVSDAFPLTSDQPLSNHLRDLLAQARLVQPAQLRMALLLNNDLASALLEQLDQPSNPTTFDSFGEFIGKPDETPPKLSKPETPVDPLPEPDSE